MHVPSYRTFQFFSKENLESRRFLVGSGHFHLEDTHHWLEHHKLKEPRAVIPRPVARDKTSWFTKRTKPQVYAVPWRPVRQRVRPTPALLTGVFDDLNNVRVLDFDNGPAGKVNWLQDTMIACNLHARHPHHAPSQECSLTRASIHAAVLRCRPCIHVPRWTVPPLYRHRWAASLQSPGSTSHQLCLRGF